MLYLVVKGTGCNSFQDIPYELGELCEAMHEMGAAREINMEIKDGNLNRVLEVLDRKFTRNGHNFTVIHTDGNILTIEQRARVVEQAPPPPPPPRAEETRQERTMQPEQAARPVPPQDQRLNPGIQLAARTTERLTIPNIQECDERRAIPQERLSSHLFSFKNDQSAAKMTRINELTRNYQSFLAEMVRVRREVEELNTETVNDASVKAVLDQIVRLRERMPGNKIEEIFITEHLLVIQTTPIIAVDSTNNARYRIGRLQFIVPLTALMSYNRHTAAIHIQNIDNVLRTNGGGWWWAPHTGQGGTCFGNASELIVEALAKRDIMALCDVMIRFYESPNMTDQQGLLVRYYPRVEGEA